MFMNFLTQKKKCRCLFYSQLQAQGGDYCDKIISSDVKKDVIGQSYYPESHRTFEDLVSNLNDLVERCD